MFTELKLFSSTCHSHFHTFQILMNAKFFEMVCAVYFYPYYFINLKFGFSRTIKNHFISNVACELWYPSAYISHPVLATYKMKRFTMDFCSFSNF